MSEQIDDHKTNQVGEAVTTNLMKNYAERSTEEGQGLGDAIAEYIDRSAIKGLDIPASTQSVAGTVSIPIPKEVAEEKITNVNHMLAKLLAENIVVLTGSTEFPLSVVVPVNNLYRNGQFDAIPVELDNVEILYMFTRTDPALGFICWCLNTDFRNGPTDEVSDQLKEGGWNVNALGELFDRHNVMENTHPLSRYRLPNADRLKKL
jgi:hypothetical protein